MRVQLAALLLGVSNLVPFPQEGDPGAKGRSKSTLDVEGEVVVIDRNGERLAKEEGALAPQFRTIGADGSRSSSVFEPDAVFVRDGRFRLRMTAGQILTVRWLRIGGRRAIVEQEEYQPRDGELLTIRARWVESILLDVRDAATGTKLDGVDVAVDWASDRAGDTHPGRLDPSRLLASNAASPVELLPPKDAPARSFREQYWVRASGRAWKRIVVDFGKQTKAYADLEPSATLVVTIAGELPSARARRYVAGAPSGTSEDRTPRLRIRKQHSKPEKSPLPSRPKLGEIVFEDRAKLGPFTIDGLARQDLIVSVEIGRASDEPLVLATTPVSLRDSGWASATLVLAAVPEPPDAVPVSGTLEVPNGWDVEELELEIKPTDLPGKSNQDERRWKVAELPQDPERPCVRQWNAGLLQPARYAVTVADAGFTSIFDVKTPGRGDVELALDEAAQVHLRFVSVGTGSPVDLSTTPARWSPDDGGNFWNLDLWKTFSSGEDGTCTLVVPAGRAQIILHCRDWMLDDPWETFTVHAGPQELIVPLVRGSGVVFELSIDANATPWPRDDGPEVTIEAVGHAGQFWFGTWGPEVGYLVQVTDPGRYRVSVAPKAGFLPIEPFEIEVPRAEYLTYVVALQRDE